jgi:hypothetical protein
MLIENIELSHALRLVEESTSGPTNQNFYDIFGTDGCSLNCNNRRAIQEFRHRRAPASSGEKKIKASMIRKAGTKSFTAEELQASVRSGCRSCEVFSLIFSQIFPEHKDTANDSTVCTYTISNEFTLCQHLETNHVTSVKRVQLFHPHSKLIF